MAAQTSSGGASQAFPNRTVRIIVTTPSGSAGDGTAAHLAGVVFNKAAGIDYESYRELIAALKLKSR